MNAFAELARTTSPTLDLLALAIAAELRAVDERAALAELDRLAAAVVAEGVGDTGVEQIEVLRRVLGEEAGFRGDEQDYDHPDNSMLDLVLERRRGLPILCSIVWIEVGRRAGIPMRGVGLPGHYVAGWFGDEAPLLVDPFRGGSAVPNPPAAERISPTPVHMTALRMLSNLVASYEIRGDVGRTLKTADLRLQLPLAERDMRVMEFERRRVGARMN